jgi:hypothetical protein
MMLRSRLVPAVLAVVIVVLAGTGIWTVGDRRDGGEERLDASMAAVVAELEAFVESARGLRFLEPVNVAVLGEAAFRRALSGGEPVEELDADVETGVLRALGLIGSGDDVGDAGEVDADSVAGFYDTDTKELVVRGARLTPFVRQVLVHELTHALDDQHFDLDPDLVDDEAALAFDALVEGNATVVEARYVASLSEADRRHAKAEEEATFGRSSGPDGPEIFLELGEFPYVDGPEFVTALLAAGGHARVDGAFRTPPTTSAEVLHPERFLAGRGRVRVPRVPAGGRVVDEGMIGEFVLRLVLAESAPEGQAVRAAAGWAGDRYVAWKIGKRTCVRTTVVLDTDADAGELVAALRTWADQHPGTTIEPGPAAPAVTFSRCA